ncbi:MAG: hypothetical protein GY866_33580 [Proteobacteria bacterium]|nr:hypothetical protein [Pseudomonadota bacterium]
MNGVGINCLLIFTMLFFISTASAADWDEITLEPPVLITSIGQSPDALMVKVLMRRNRIKFTHDNLAKPEMLDRHKSVIMVVGYSGKGLGAAGISKEQEIARSRALLDAAKAKKIPIVMAHIGGKSRMGPSSQVLIEMVAEKADCLVYVASPELEAPFAKMVETYGMPAKSAKKISKTGPLFKELFK